MRVISIDPGYDKVGVAILEDKDVLLYSDCIKTSRDDVFEKRLGLIIERISEVIKKYKPEAMAIENLFFSKNKKTAMRVSEARGAIIQEATSKNLKVYEYTPLQIKIAVTGYGKSDKRQVISMVENLVEIDKEIKEDDEYDAIACGLTCLASVKNSTQSP